MPDTVKVLKRFGIPTRGADAAVLQHELAQLLHDMPESLVIIDDVVDWTFVNDFLPGNIKCHIIATSNRRPPKIWRPHTVQVQDMEPAEGKQLALHCTTRLSDKQAEEMARLLRYRPLAIAHCAGYLQNTPGIAPMLLLDALSHNVAATLSSVADATEQNLRSIYSSTVTDLGATHPAAVWLLEAAAFTQPILDNQSVYIGDELVGLSYIMVRVYAEAPDSTSLSTAVLTYNRAMQLLRDRYLLTSGTSGMKLHPLTVGILRDLFSSRALMVHVALHSAGKFILSIQDEEQRKRLIALLLSQRIAANVSAAEAQQSVNSIAMKELVDELPVVALKLGLVVLGYMQKYAAERAPEQGEAPS
jgi:hypothetical protein